MSLITPEIIIQNAVELILAHIRSDWDNNTDKTKTTLYKLWNGVKYGRYDMYAEAQSVFLRKKDDPRLIRVRPSFDKEQANIPTIFVNLPSEEGGFADGLGMDQNEVDVTYDDDNLTYTNNYGRGFSSNYNIVISSENRNEILLIYHTIRALLIPLFNHMMFDGLEVPKLSGRDLQIYSELVPNHIFMRAIGLSISYRVNVDDITAKQMAQSITFTGTPVLSDEINLKYDDGESESISS